MDELTIRQAERADVDNIADAHRDSIQCTSVYVRGQAARRGLGTVLLRRAEAHAIAAGAAAVRIEASLAGAVFYEVSGYVEVGRGEISLRSGHPIQCVFMRKSLTPGGC